MKNAENQTLSPIPEPIYKYPATFRDYEMNKEDRIYCKGWNDAMNYAFYLESRQIVSDEVKKSGKGSRR